MRMGNRSVKQPRASFSRSSSGAHYKPPVCEQIDCDQGRGEDPLHMVSQPGRINDGEEIVGDEATAVTRLTREFAKVVLEWR